MRGMHVLSDFDRTIAFLCTDEIMRTTYEKLAKFYRSHGVHLDNGKDQFDPYALFQTGWSALCSRLPYEEAASVQRIAESMLTEAELPCLRYVQAVEGVDLALAELKQAGRLVGIASNNSEIMLRKAISILGFTDYIDGLVGRDPSDVFASMKPSARPITRLAALLNIDPAQCMMIGDTPADMLSGAEAGVRVRVGVLTGLSTPEELTRSGADLVIPSFADLPKALQNWRTKPFGL